ncbi:uncharacterized protein BP5553_02032 [Venustampulla echinocandica]|uniref:MARVEL domain-containing protein n=1 Tax=Venustampulla echinocandica TaxID=2656787 RepID=A0A370U2V8_9HELO|nr:uncharacterized protein BP5553_02032 [Venustampulla echinocandica]RDL42053.1 hypothetical protein BP5553_02032 [Venustampulla echinocandica]
MHPSTTTDATTGVSPEQDVEKNSSLAPLLTSYSASVAMDPDPSNTPPPTAGLTDGKAKNGKPTGVQRVYARKGGFLLGQWFFTFWVLGATAQSLRLASELRFAVPMLAYTVVCASIHVVPMYYFAMSNKPVSPTNSRPPQWYLVTYAISSVAWFAAMACVVLVLVDTLPFDGDEDIAKGLQKCGKHKTYKCYHATKNAQINTLAKMNTATAGFITLFIIGHWYQISKLWWCTFTADEIREAYEFNPSKK